MITYFNNYNIKVNNSETIDLADLIEQKAKWDFNSMDKNYMKEYCAVFRHKNGKYYRIFYKFPYKLVQQIINNADTYMWANKIKYLPFEDYSYIDRIVKLSDWTDISKLVSNR